MRVDLMIQSFQKKTDEFKDIMDEALSKNDAIIYEMFEEYYDESFTFLNQLKMLLDNGYKHCYMIPVFHRNGEDYDLRFTFTKIRIKYEWQLQDINHIVFGSDDSYKIIYSNIFNWEINGEAYYIYGDFGFSYGSQMQKDGVPWRNIPEYKRIDDWRGNHLDDDLYEDEKENEEEIEKTSLKNEDSAHLSTLHAPA